jgi:tetratricopeptide (TPR) repeat protein
MKGARVFDPPGGQFGVPLFPIDRAVFPSFSCGSVERFWIPGGRRLPATSFRQLRPNGPFLRPLALATTGPGAQRGARRALSHRPPPWQWRNGPGLGQVFAARRDFAAAQRLFEDAMEMARKANLQQGLLDSLVRLGATLKEIDDYSGAQARLDEALPLARELSNRRLEAEVLIEIAGVASRTGSLPAAESRLRAAVAIRRTLENKAEASLALAELGGRARGGGGVVRGQRASGRSPVVGDVGQ